MTNHHCSEPVVSELQKEGENFDKNGFYASTYAEERRNPELFVEQLIIVADITDKMKAKLANVANDSEKMAKTEEAMASVKKNIAR